MSLSAEQIQSNWEKFIGYINTYISDPRREKVLAFYKKFEDDLVLMPASHKTAYHNAFPGGYLDHVLRVNKIANQLHKLYAFHNANESYTGEELNFVSLFCQLGKLGDWDNEYFTKND